MKKDFSPHKTERPSFVQSGSFGGNIPNAKKQTVPVPQSADNQYTAADGTITGKVNGKKAHETSSSPSALNTNNVHDHDEKRSHGYDASVVGQRGHDYEYQSVEDAKESTTQSAKKSIAKQIGLDDPTGNSNGRRGN